MTFNWDQLMGITPAVNPGFVPHFREGQLVYNTATGQSYGLNDDYFATLETAQYIAKKYGDGNVYEAPHEAEGVGTMVTAKIYVTKLPNGRGVNTGTLAAYYKRNPESQFPGLAEKLIRLVLQNG